MGCVVVNCVVETAAIKTAVGCSEEVLTGGSGRAVTISQNALLKFKSQVNHESGCRRSSSH
jgi:hypothetical protein